MGRERKAHKTWRNLFSPVSWYMYWRHAEVISTVYWSWLGDHCQSQRPMSHLTSQLTWQCTARSCATHIEWPSDCPVLHGSCGCRTNFTSSLYWRSLQLTPTLHLPLHHLCGFAFTQQVGMREFSWEHLLWISCFLVWKSYTTLSDQNWELLSMDRICYVQHVMGKSFRTLYDAAWSCTCVISIWRTIDLFIIYIPLPILLITLLSY